MVQGLLSQPFEVLFSTCGEENMILGLKKNGSSSSNNNPGDCHDCCALSVGHR